jgi:hypothetical protein
VDIAEIVGTFILFSRTHAGSPKEHGCLVSTDDFVRLGANRFSNVNATLIQHLPNPVDDVLDLRRSSEPPFGDEQALV